MCEERERERERERLNRALLAISNCNQALIQANDETESLNKIRKIVVEVSDYRMAWVGYAENDTGKSVRPVADAGFDESYLQTLHISWADVERGRGPTGTAIRTGAPSTISNVGTDPRFAPWRHEAINRGYVSALSLPLQEGDTVFGALTIYAAYPDTFNRYGSIPRSLLREKIISI